MTRTAKILSVVFCLLVAMATPGWSIEVGQPSADFSIQAFDGRNFSRATLEGKPFLLVFWNTWCPICMQELPKINRLAERLGPGGPAILGINTGINDNESKARAYWEKSGYVFSSGFDRHFEITTAFRVRGVPTIFLVDSKGVVRYKQAQLPEDIEDRLKQLSLR